MKKTLCIILISILVVIAIVAAIIAICCSMGKPTIKMDFSKVDIKTLTIHETVHLVMPRGKYKSGIGLYTNDMVLIGEIKFSLNKSSEASLTLEKVVLLFLLQHHTETFKISEDGKASKDVRLKITGLDSLIKSVKFEEMKYLGQVVQDSGHSILNFSMNLKSLDEPFEFFDYMVIHDPAFEKDSDLCKISTKDTNQSVGCKEEILEPETKILMFVAQSSGKQPVFGSCRMMGLHFAAAKGHKEVVGVLLEKGADFNAKNIDGATPLHLAAENGHGEVVDVLLEKGADFNAKDNNGATPLHLAAAKWT